MAWRIRETDWSATPLDRLAAWPQSLKLSLTMILALGFPMADPMGLIGDAYPHPPRQASQASPNGIGGVLTTRAVLLWRAKAAFVTGARAAASPHVEWGLEFRGGRRNENGEHPKC